MEEKGNKGEWLMDWKTKTSLMKIITIQLNVYKYIHNQYWTQLPWWQFWHYHHLGKSQVPYWDSRQEPDSGARFGNTWIGTEGRADWVLLRYQPLIILTLNMVHMEWNTSLVSLGSPLLFTPPCKCDLFLYDIPAWHTRFAVTLVSTRASKSKSLSACQPCVVTINIKHYCF